MRRQQTLSVSATVVFALMCLVSSAHAQDGGVSILSPETLYPDGIQAYSSYGYALSLERQRARSRANNPDDLQTSEHRLSIGGNYGLPKDLISGVTKDMTVSLNVPLFRREFRTRIQGRVVDDAITGLGDIGLFARKRFLRYAPDGTKSTMYHFSVVAGIEFPTGESTIKREGVTLPRSLQPGRGGFSATFGYLMAFEFDHLELFSTTLLRWRSFAGDSYDFGDTISQEVKAAYRIVEEEYPGQSLSPSLAIRYSATTANKEHGRELPDSGRRSVELVPGVVWHAFAYDHDLGFGLDLNIQISIPVFQDVNGTQASKLTSAQVSAGLRF